MWLLVVSQESIDNVMHDDKSVVVASVGTHEVTVNVSGSKSGGASRGTLPFE